MSAKIPLENKAFERWPIFYKVIVAKNINIREPQTPGMELSAVTANTIAAFLKNNQKEKISPTNKPKYADRVRLKRARSSLISGQ